MGEITELKSASRVHKDEWTSNGVPFYRSSDVMAAINGTENEKAFISEELYDAAAIDGCSQARFFFSIALPLSGAIIAIMVLYYGVGHWNEYFNSLLYMKTDTKFPLQLVLRSILVQNQSQSSQTVTSVAQQKSVEEKRQLVELMKYSLIIVSSVPVLVIYPLVQKHFVKGVMIGSVKG